MKAIKLSCKSAGFKYGDTAEIGDKKGQISAKDAEALVAGGFATEVKDVVVSSGNGDDTAKVTELTNANGVLEAKVTELTDANGVLEAKVTELTDGADEALQTRIAELEEANEKLDGFVIEAIGLKKFEKPVGYEA